VADTHLLTIHIGVIQRAYKMLQALWPIPRLKRTQERYDILARRVTNHDRRVGEGLKDCGLDELGHLWRSREDESRIVLEKESCDRPYTIFFLGERTEDVRQVGDVLWGARKLVKFLRWRDGARLAGNSGWFRGQIGGILG